MSVACDLERSVREIRAGLLGCGRIGQAVIRSAHCPIAAGGLAGTLVRPVAALVRDRTRPRSDAPSQLCTDVSTFFSQPLDVVVEVMGGVEPAFTYVRAALERGIPVVTANKTLLAHRGPHLRDLARQYRTRLVGEAAVIAGVPFLGALERRPLARSTTRLTGILNGTSHFLVGALAAGIPFADALDHAVARGYAEPDCTADVSGRDAAEKLTILAHLLGCPELQPADLPTIALGVLEAADFQAARLLSGTLKPVAIACFDGDDPGAWIGPALVDAAHAAASSSGVFNFLELQSGAGVPVTFSGPGAGEAVTAATILDDILEVVGDEARAVSPANTPTVPASCLHRPMSASWYVRVSGVGRPPASSLAALLSAHQVPALHVASAPEFVAARTTVAPWEVADVVRSLLRDAGLDVLLLPVVEGWPA